MTTHHYQLARFVEAQQPVYPQVVAELTRGRKQSHWMWFIFPQLRGLGHSSMAHRYGIAGLSEATAYLAHPTLGVRLRECTNLVHTHAHSSLAAIFGSPDDLKFHSSMTLFAAAITSTGKQNSIFAEALLQRFDGQPDTATLRLLRTL